ncbi:hypothetical protein AMATHDRAFT_135022, partial [Amanita thiersii Skay4041]
YQISVVHASELGDHDRESIWSIFETNMHDAYINSSFGWEPEHKIKELFHPLSRFLLVSRERIVAYCMLRFEVEESEAIVYCYEVQVSPAIQRMGLGKRLMQLVLQIATVWHMDRIMLTVFKSNKGAFELYRGLGFRVDETSPGQCGEEVEYEILSRDVDERAP